jgi:hypothetical protein
MKPMRIKIVKQMRLFAAVVALALGFFYWHGHGEERSPAATGRKYTSVERVGRERLRAVHADRLRYAKERAPVMIDTGYQDFRAVLHAHAEDSAHTGGTRPEMLRAAQATGVQIIMLTDHVRKERDFINDSWRGLRESVLWIPGAEHEGFLAYPMQSLGNAPWTSRAEFIALVKRAGGNIFLSHPEERMDWPTDQLDGMEIYNHHTDIKDESEYNAWMRGALVDPERLAELTRLLEEYPIEVFGAQQDYLASIIAKWDRESQSHRLTGVAANDCHHNQVFTITVAEGNAITVAYTSDGPKSRRVTVEQAPKIATWLGTRKPGELIAKLDFDPYERSFLYVTTHILAKELTETAVRDALRKGHVYVAHDWLCDPTGFLWMAEGRAGASVKSIMGDEVKLAPGLRLLAAAPHPAKIKLFRNGMLMKELTTDRATWPVTEPGVYRVEAWLAVGGEERPWIYSNPIYVK